MSNVNVIDINKIYEPHIGQLLFHKSKVRYRLLLAGRRSGKTFSASFETVMNALKVPNGLTWVVAPSKNVGDAAWGELLKTLNKIVPRNMMHSATKNPREVRLKNGHLFQFKSAHKPEDLVGVSLDFLWVDEAARVKEKVWQNNLYPCLDKPTSRAIFTTTPLGKNWIWEMNNKCLSNDYPEYELFRFPTSMNTHNRPGFVEDSRKELPELTFRQEFLAEFMDDAGVDLARKYDYSVLTVIKKSTGKVVAWDRFKDITWSFQRERIKALADKYRAICIIDGTGLGDPNVESLIEAGCKVEPFIFTNTSKYQLIQHLAIKLEQGLICFPDIPVLINELRMFEYEITASGNIKYGAPSGHHDDTVISLALAVWMIKNKKAGKMFVF
jgi:hypothetical protein